VTNNVSTTTNALKERLEALLDYFSRKVITPTYFLLLLLYQVRFSVLAVIVALAVVSFSGQFNHILINYNLEANFHKMVLFGLATWFWATQAWAWSRHSLNIRYQKSLQVDKASSASAQLSKYQKSLITWLPRLNGFLAFVFAVIAAYKAGAIAVAWMLIFLSALFVFYVWARKKSTKGFIKRFFYTDFLWWHWRKISFLVAGVSAIAVNLIPLNISYHVGSGVLFFWGIACIIPVGSYICLLGQKYKIPFMAIFLIIAPSTVAFFDQQHQVRLVEGMGTDSEIKHSKQRPTIEDAYNRWRGDSETEKPMVLVATAGGGIRAGYWTAAVLSKLDQESSNNNFQSQLFAISGVSGGTVGASFYLAAKDSLNQSDDLKEHCPNTASLKSDTYSQPWRERLLSSVNKDYLAPIVAAMLFTDLPQSLFGDWFPSSVSDRAEALERAWERGFCDHFKVNSMAKPFRALYGNTPLKNNSPDKPWLPLLFSNSTSEIGGKRLIATPVSFIESNIEGGAKTSWLKDSYDIFELNGDSMMALSTVAHNSARFTYVSPAGGVYDKKDLVTRAIDGGYFENFGAQTLRELIAKIRTLNENQKFIIIAISNNTHFTENVALFAPQIGRPCADEKIQSKEACKPDSLKPADTTGWDQLMAPGAGLLNAREAHAYFALSALYQETAFSGSNDQFFHFHLQGIHNLPEDFLKKYEKEIDTPQLGWYLSAGAVRNMNLQVDKLLDEKVKQVNEAIQP